VREAIEAAGARLLYLPAYSPDLNPIEMLFAKLKSQLRCLATKTISALWDALGAVSKAVPPDECSNFIRHAGYFQSA
jgi:transposase